VTPAVGVPVSCAFFFFGGGGGVRFKNHNHDNDRVFHVCHDQQNFAAMLILENSFRGQSDYFKYEDDSLKAFRKGLA
jgi:hypothetical protein